MLPVRRKDKTKVTDPSKRRAPKQERELAKALGGSLTPASGAKAVKGDVRIKGFARVEAKCTRNKSFSVTLDILEKIEDAAASCADGEVPVLHVEFLDPAGRRIKGLYVLREVDAEELLTKGAQDAHVDGKPATARGGITPVRRTR